MDIHAPLTGEIIDMTVLTAIRFRVMAYSWHPDFDKRWEPVQDGALAATISPS